MRPCAFFTCYYPTREKTRFNDNFFSSGSLFEFVNKKNNARILSAILLICILLKIKERGTRSVVCHIIVVVTE